MKVITKILDNYCSDKLIETIKDEIYYNHFVDVRTKDNGNKVWVEVKKQKYKDNQYETIFGFYKREAFAHLIDVEKVREKVNKNVEFYLKKERV